MKASAEPTEDTAKSVWQLADKGYSPEQIQAMTGVAKSTVKRLLASRPKPRR